jgi:pimeloyl-ACP methyl ester carboxylesterase
MTTAMKRWLPATIPLVLIVLASLASAQEQVVDVPTRPGVIQRFLLIAPESTTATVVLFPGGHGGLRISPDGKLGWGGGNFLVRTRRMFAEQGLMVAVVDAPSDRQSEPYLGGFRQTPMHVADVKAVIAWLRQERAIPVWLVGTSRGTQSAAFVATQLAPADGGPDGLVLTSTMLADPRGRPVPDMPLQNLRIPTLVVHHRNDGCRWCLYRFVPTLMDRLPAAPRKELLTFDGGSSRGDPCEAFAHHGYNGIEAEVVGKIAAWITTTK